MDPWYCVVRNDWIIQVHFQNRWKRAGCPNDAALFGRFDIRANKRTFYFNPEAALLAPDLLEIYRAVECKSPNLASLALLVGDEKIIDGPYV